MTVRPATIARPAVSGVAKCLAVIATGTLLCLAHPVLAAVYRAPGNVVVEAPKALAPAKARKFADRIADERRRVQEWWGPAFTGELRLRVLRKRGPARSLILAWHGGKRGIIEVPLWRVRENKFPSLHEIVHVYAPNGSRFLAEGLAVYAQEALGGCPAYPNYGKDLHVTARDADDDTSLAVLDGVTLPTTLGRVGNGQHMYLLAGSFVRFLIETAGLGKFRELYARTPFVPGQRVAAAPERWREVYGRSLTELETAWRARLASLPEKPAPEHRFSPYCN